MHSNSIIRKIEALTYISLVSRLLNILKDMEKQDGPSRFWHPLILLKWSIEFAETNPSAREATRTDIVQLLEMVDKLEMTHNAFNLRTNERVSHTFTILSYQQFLYQDKASWDAFARQDILFNKLRSKYDIAPSFYKMTNINLSVFIRFLHILYIIIFLYEDKKSGYKGYLNKDLILFLISLYGADEVHSILKLFTIERASIKQVIAEDARQSKDYNLQSFEVSIFTRKPIFFHNGIPIIPHKDVLNHTMNHFVYDYMKNKDNEFCTELGARMEKYMKLGLIETGLSYQTENELEKLLGKGKKLVDFLVEEIVLVEAKAIELKPSTGINPSAYLLGSELKQNIVKAYAHQMLSVANSLTTSSIKYGIIVTYKELYLGDSQDIWEQFLELGTKAVLGEDTGQLLALPVENLFFMDLSTWDLLMSVIKKEKISLIDLLEKVKNTNANPKTKKFLFEMHLHEYKPYPVDLDFLNKAYEEIKPQSD
jgi:hypothetical protein